MIDEHRFDNIDPNEVEVIKEFESLIKKPIPKVSVIFMESVNKLGRRVFKHQLGFTAKNGHITGLGLSPRNYGSVLYPDFQLVTIPESLKKLKYLKLLDLSSNGLTSIPGVQLRPGLNYLPSWFGELKSLESLHMSWNKITSLPESFGNLTNLKVFYIYKNNLRTLPKSFGNLKKLEKLFLSQNSLKDLPASFGKLIELKELDIQQNKLETLPESFGQLFSLKNLILTDNKINQLKPTIGYLSNLEHIDLSKNKLEHLDPSIGDLTKLRSLVIQSNKLLDLPESIGRLTNLEYLDLTNNNLTDLPSSLLKMENLKRIEFKQNDWNVEIQKALSKNLKTLNNYLREKAGIHLLLLHESEDDDEFDIDKMVKYLESFKEIFNVYHSKNGFSNGFQEFEKNVMNSNIALALITSKSIKSKNYRQKLKIIRNHNLKLMVMKSSDVAWENLAIFGLDKDCTNEYCMDDENEFFKQIFETIVPKKKKKKFVQIDKDEIEWKILELKGLFIDIIGKKEFQDYIGSNILTVNEVMKSIGKDPKENADKIVRIMRQFMLSD